MINKFVASTIKDQLPQQIKEALKKQDKVRVSTLRLLLSALNNEQIAKQRELLGDEELVIVRRQMKQREEAIEAYLDGNRPEAAERERHELSILNEFMPEQMGEGEIGELVEKLISQLGAKGQGDFGKVMQAVMQKVKGRVDGKLVSEIVRTKL